MLVFVALEFSDILFRLGGNNHCLSTFFLSECLNLLREGVTTLRISLAHIADIQHGLGSQQKEITCTVLLVFAFKLNDTRVFALLQHLFVGLEHSDLNLRLLIACSSSLLRLRQATLDGL